MDINFHQMEQMAQNGAPEYILIDYVCMELQLVLNLNLVEVYLPNTDQKNNLKAKKTQSLDQSLISLCDKAIKHEQSLLTIDADNNCIFIAPLYPKNLKYGSFIFFKANADELIDRNQMESLVKKFSTILKRSKSLG